MRLAAGSAIALVVGALEVLVTESTAEPTALVAEETLLSASSLEHAAAPKIATAAIPAAAADFR
ncbi:hypothetical protein NGTWS0302_05180 [Mycolicibacterium cyprinidarum]|uniref:Uncharacterized protein n=1 Tax=Mycolicibacterium cyprinidarum TaxID=2860311 RepID=A0ABQ4V619_9MYCO|nr:hypothetical protein NGTWS1803_15380 [Mycolicibacterium sp. NGTWS1803]GJF11155.1 hypothetical protein NGTWS1702_07960 [Mycolicibacterium sp. NGTWSNA01]GJF13803.1 hypothetical protein NGTWS0302_05180 [Mycolicibacterium sp. NGTWS0302]